MKQVLNVEIDNSKKNYDIYIENSDIYSTLSEIFKLLENKKKLFVISKKVYNLYKKELCINPKELFILNDGEKEKNHKNYLKILQKASDIGLTRKDAIVAIGGGVVGDISGFVASTYMRGIDFIQVPTTLLSMVDSSVGGKTALNMFNTKNIVGSFYQPKAVFININFLKTLSKKEFSSGLGEVLKYAFIEETCNFKHPLFFFEYLTLSSNKVLEKEDMTIMRLIEYCLNLKIAIVNQDEKENNLRRILNLGHTVGHALEAITNYKKFTHGEAVIQGIYFIFNYAYSKGLITYSYYRLSIDLLNKYGFKQLLISKRYSPQKLIEIMKKDKKASQEIITFVVPTEKKQVSCINLNEEAVLQMF